MYLKQILIYYLGHLVYIFQVLHCLYQAYYVYISHEFQTFIHCKTLNYIYGPVQHAH